MYEEVRIDKTNFEIILTFCLDFICWTCVSLFLNFYYGCFVGRLKSVDVFCQHIIIENTKNGFLLIQPYFALMLSYLFHRNGGLRFGEMERDCFALHGVAASLRHNTFLNSDKFSTYFCKCGSSVIANEEKGEFICPICKENSEGISKVNLPYVATLLKHELQAMNINLSIKTSK